MISDVFILWLAAIPLMGSPGPATLSLAALGSAYGIKKSVSYYVGIVLGTTGVLIMIAMGLTGLLLAQPKLALVVTIAAAVYILYLAFRIATAPVGKKIDDNTSPPAFSSGFVLAIANPKAFAAIGAVYSGNIIIEGNMLADALAKIGLLIVVIVLVNYLWLVGGSLFSSVLSNPRSSRIVNVLFALLLVASVGLALVS
ncbi:MAG: LysE family transporter [Acidiferrobacterales bacterium]|nr:LysE family transporter [Acidiferrobacterales bacterium]